MHYLESLEYLHNFFCQNYFSFTIAKKYSENWRRILRMKNQKSYRYVLIKPKSANYPIHVLIEIPNSCSEITYETFRCINQIEGVGFKS